MRLAPFKSSGRRQISRVGAATGPVPYEPCPGPAGRRPRARAARPSRCGAYRRRTIRDLYDRPVRDADAALGGLRGQRRAVDRGRDAGGRRIGLPLRPVGRRPRLLRHRGRALRQLGHLVRRGRPVRRRGAAAGAGGGRATAGRCPEPQRHRGSENRYSEKHLLCVSTTLWFVIRQLDLSTIHFPIPSRRESATPAARRIDSARARQSSAMARERARPYSAG